MKEKERTFTSIKFSNLTTVERVEEREKSLSERSSESKEATLSMIAFKWSEPASEDEDRTKENA